MEKYDHIGQGYNRSRRADPYLSERMFALLSPHLGLHFVDVGCGTGNYTIALQERGMNITGIDPSATMLDKARQQAPEKIWIQGKAEDIPLQADAADGVLCSLTLHHWGDLRKGLGEVKRILKPEGKLLIFTAGHQQMRGYWLNHYFPKMLEDSIQQMPSLEAIDTALASQGMKIAQTEKYFIQPDLQDLFLYSGKHDPKLYFEETVRSGISSFSNLAHLEEVNQGLERLAADIKDGSIYSLIKDYENEGGDYIFLLAR